MTECYALYLSEGKFDLDGGGVLDGWSEEFVPRAMRAYFRRYGKEAQQPANSSEVRAHKGKPYVVLENCKGVLAVYRIRPDESLKGLRRWPKALEEY